MLVDTGSTYIILPPKTTSELGLLKTPYMVELVLADKRKVKARLFLGEVEVKGRRGSHPHSRGRANATTRSIRVNIRSLIEPLVSGLAVGVQLPL